MTTKKARQLDHDDLGSTLTRTDKNGSTTMGVFESAGLGSFGIRVQYGEYSVILQPDDVVDLT
ncbi:hypothetical protein C1N74_06400 [Microbacterium sp. SGAir0570]|uniref:hypothetical protein n=1 Tax=Microbacterium sp. SGAir0570 TaxID=2070348 RepID=UPI0010CCB55B|nr:hypothetical protein [Microbacterium sp. SGAir0570]QCR40090.1 hypothetical protein C1N74_06400 [Microbacterium sp. SGAir0570]